MRGFLITNNFLGVGGIGDCFRLPDNKQYLGDRGIGDCFKSNLPLPPKKIQKK